MAIVNRELWNRLSVEERGAAKAALVLAEKEGRAYTLYSDTNEVIVSTSKSAAEHTIDEMRGYSVFPRVTKDTLAVDKELKIYYRGVLHDDDARAWARAEVESAREAKRLGKE